MNIVCFGDSITHGPRFSDADRWPGVLQEKLENLQPGKYKVYNRGISGNTTSNALARINTDVIPLLPGIVIVEFGFNDANFPETSKAPNVSIEDFKKNLRDISSIITTHKGRPVFIVNHTVGDVKIKQGNNKKYVANFESYNLAIYELAAESNAPFIDLPHIMDVEKVDLAVFLGEDGLHVSAQGNHTYASMVFDALRLQKIVQ